MALESLNIEITLPENDLDAVRERVVAALKEEGFGILTEIDVQATLKQKIGEDFRPYRILGACNPRLAHQALERVPEIGLLLPCNVVLDARDGRGTAVRFANPAVLLEWVEDPELAPVAAEADARIRRVAEALRSA